jgi:hypothetical protein
MYAEIEEKVERLESALGEFVVRTTTILSRMDRESQKMNIQWGNLANKMGTLVEDVILPSLPAIIKEKYNLEIDEVMQRRLKRHSITKNIKEYDGVVIAGNYVFLNSIKSSLKQKDIEEFAKEIYDFRQFYPEYNDKKIIGIFASLNPDTNFIQLSEDNGFLVLGLGDWLMELKNNENFRPKEW